MDPETAALASTAAATLVTVLTTDAWTQVKKEIGALWRRFRPDRADAVEADLGDARVRALAVAGDDAARRLLTAEWQSRLTQLLDADPGAAPELARVAGTLASLVPGTGPTLVQHARASGHGTVIQAGRDARIGKLC